MPLSRKKQPPQVLTSDPQRFTLLRVLSIATAILLAAIGLATAVFFYSFIYKRAADVRVIMQSRSEGAVHLIDFDRLARIEEAWAQKHGSSTLPLPRDPFSAPATTPASGPN